MQGFNRYIPPDYDPKKHSTLNSYQGKKHALGNRAKDIDKGVLVVRFELPFPIWCGTCNNHIGAGVRYNARKSKVGNYYSTPIYAFRCKCHLCDGWFEIQTDPKNAQYVVTEGATKKNEDWDPAENGGFAVFDTEAPKASEEEADPFEHLEKDTDQRSAEHAKKSRLDELTENSARMSADPYAVSRALRDRFRAEKRQALAKQSRDDGVREKYGLHDGVHLGDEDVGGSKERWAASRENRGLSISSGDLGPARTAKAALSATIRKNTAKRYDAFDVQADRVPKMRASVNKSATAVAVAGIKKKGDRADKPEAPPSAPAGLGGLLSAYNSDSD